MAIVAKRTVMTLYTDLQDIYSHQVRIVMAEKGVNVEIHPIKEGIVSEDLLDLNPYGSVPTLVDRDLVLYNANIIMEYLDERFPHPPLLPVYPVARAESRKMMYRIDNDWYSLLKIIEEDGDAGDSARIQLLESIVNLEPVFDDKAHFLSDGFSLLDCVLAPLLWRFPQLGIEIPESAKAIHRYMKKVFERDSFKTSIADIKRELFAA